MCQTIVLGLGLDLDFDSYIHNTCVYLVSEWFACLFAQAAPQSYMFNPMKNVYDSK